MIRRLLAAAPGLLFAAVAVTAACGDGSLASPSPEAIETAQSVSRPAAIDAPYSTTPEKGDEEREPIVLNGRVFGDGGTGVILAHMRPADQTAWFPFATELAATGKFTVLTFDFRGYGESTGDKQFDRIDTDLLAALEYMRETLGIERVFLVGASMGGTASLVVASRMEVAGVVAISAPTPFQGLDAAEAVPLIDAPKLFITSEDDVPQARSQEQFWELAREPRAQEIYEGNAHGTDLFDSPHAAAVKERILRFLTSN